jgi:hypothetical protein
MTDQTIYCLTSDLSRTIWLLCQLDNHGVGRDCMSLLLAERRLAPKEAALLDSGVLAALAGPTSHIDVFANLGPLVAIGPFQETLRAAAIASPVGGIIGALVRLGLSLATALTYAGGLRDGRILVVLRTADRRESERLHRVLSELGANGRAGTASA